MLEINKLKTIIFLHIHLSLINTQYQSIHTLIIILTILINSLWSINNIKKACSSIEDAKNKIITHQDMTRILILKLKILSLFIEPLFKSLNIKYLTNNKDNQSFLIIKINRNKSIILVKKIYHQCINWIFILKIYKNLINQSIILIKKYITLMIQYKQEIVNQDIIYQSNH